MAAVRARVPIALGRGNVRAQMVTFAALSDGREHVACVFGEPGSAPLVRMHSECLTGDVFGSSRCDCGPQLDEAVDRLGRGGVLLYLRQEGRGIGLYNKLDAYLLQDAGADTFEANRLLGRGEDERDYGVAAEMLGALGVRRIRLLTNNPDKVLQLRRCGVEVESVERTGLHLTHDNGSYLQAKIEHGHRPESPWLTA